MTVDGGRAPVTSPAVVLIRQRTFIGCLVRIQSALNDETYEIRYFLSVERKLRSAKHITIFRYHIFVIQRGDFPPGQQIKNASCRSIRIFRPQCRDKHIGINNGINHTHLPLRSALASLISSLISSKDNSGTPVDSTLALIAATALIAFCCEADI